MSKNYSGMAGTGGGPSCFVPFNYLEERVVLFFRNSFLRKGSTRENHARTSGVDRKAIKGINPPPMDVKL